jgi:hypothetical protein
MAEVGAEVELANAVDAKMRTSRRAHGYIDGAAFYVTYLDKHISGRGPNSVDRLIRTLHEDVRLSAVERGLGKAQIEVGGDQATVQFVVPHC